MSDKPADAGPSAASGAVRVGAGPTASPAANGASATPPGVKPKPPPRPVPPFLKPLQFMGVPQGILTWQPRLPSRNWSIFYGVTISLTSLYVYDRRECKRIKQEYTAQLAHLAKEPLLPREYPRKVMVYTVRSPGDDDYEKGLLFFKKYVKPFIVAAGIDWETTIGSLHGGLARGLRERHYARRRQLLGLEAWGTQPSTSPKATPDPYAAGMIPFSLTPQQQMERELDGGVIIVGRAALKEWAWGLREGWTTSVPPKRQDLDDALARQLSEDGAFDEVEEKAQDGGFVEQDHSISLTSTDNDDSGAEADGAGAPLPSRLGTGPVSFNPAYQKFNKDKAAGGPLNQRMSNLDEGSFVDPSLLEPPAEIPAQPPITFVDFVNLTGFRHLPRRIVGFFRHRDRFELGGQAALDLALGRKAEAREFDVVLHDDVQSLPNVKAEPPQGGDLDWGLASERFYLPRFLGTLKDIEKQREQYYKDLKRRLQDTRSYVRGERELTATEKNDPPKNEGALRQERFNKEKEWRLLAQGYDILRPDAGVAWHPAFRGRLRVFRNQEKVTPVATMQQDE